MATSKVLSMRLREEQMARLQRVARRLNRTPSETAALLVEEALRMSEFAFIEFRDSAAGRQAYVRGTGMAVWEFIMVAGGSDGDAEKVAALLELPLIKVQAAFNYAQAFPKEVEASLEDNNKSFEELKRLLPNIQLFHVGDLNEEDAGERTVIPDQDSAHETPSR